MKFREIVTDFVVDVAGLPMWEGEPAFAVVTYPNGRKLYLRWETVWLHFQQLPGEVSLEGGDSISRPTAAQEALTAAIVKLVEAARGR